MIRALIVFIALQAYLGVGIGIGYVANVTYEVRCGIADKLDGGDMVFLSVAWPIAVVGAGVATLADLPTKPCPAR